MHQTHSNPPLVRQTLVLLCVDPKVFTISLHCGRPWDYHVEVYRSTFTTAAFLLPWKYNSFIWSVFSSMRPWKSAIWRRICLVMLNLYAYGDSVNRCWTQETPTPMSHPSSFGLISTGNLCKQASVANFRFFHCRVMQHMQHSLTHILPLRTEVYTTNKV